jgi:hypothetical protein
VLPPSRRLASLSLSLAVTAYGVVAAGQSVRPYHPRLFLNAAGQRGIAPATARGRCTSGAGPWARACRIAAPLPSSVPFQRNPPLTLINNALRYLLYGEDAALNAVRDEANRVGPAVDRGDESGQHLAHAPRALHLAVAYDWLYDALPPDGRATLQSYLESYADYAITHEPRDVFSSEAYAQAATVGLVGLALASASDTPMTPAQRYIAYANARWRSALLPAMGYTRGWWPEGPAWMNAYVARYALYFAVAWTTATGEDLVAWARGAGDPFGGLASYYAYGLRPDLRFPAFGDAPGETPPGATGNRPVLDMLAWATGLPVAQALSNEVTLRLPPGQDYTGGEAWHQVVFYDPMRTARPARAELPLGAHLAPGTSDVVVMRGGWDDPGAAHVVLSCGDWFTRRQHIEAGSFQIYRGAPLAAHTGSWDGYETRHWVSWYAQRSVHANTLAIVRPGETFPNARMLPSVNDGGQRAMPYDDRGRASVNEHRINLTAGAQLDTGSVTAFETARYHDYAACDLTRAYNSVAVIAPGAQAKVREVTRQMVMLRPELVVVFDRVEVTDPAYERRFVLHGLGRPVAERDGVFTLSRAGGRLLGRTLLPTDATRATVDGYTVDGVTVPPMVPIDENRGARLEVSARGRAREYFLHVLDATDTQREGLPPMSLVEDGDRVGVRVADPTADRTYTVTFSRTGAARGEIRVMDGRGAALYGGTLGMGGTMFPVVQDAGVSGADAGARDGGSGRDGGATPPPTEPGCGCRAQGSERGRWGALWGAVVLAVGARRMRRGTRGSSPSRAP